MKRREASSAAGPDGPGDETLVERALAGDHDAFAMLFRRHAPDVHAFAQRRTRSVHVADDVVATTFEKAWRSLDRLAGDGGRFRPWVFRIAGNEMVSDHRSRERRARREHLAAVRGEVASERPGLATDGHTADELAASESSAAVLEALGTLSERHQEVISLRHIAGLTPDETARALGISRGHVAVRLHRAMAELRRHVDEQGEAGGRG